MSADRSSDTLDAAHQSLGPLVSEHGPGPGQVWGGIIAGGVFAVLLLAGAGWAAASGVSGMGWAALGLTVLSLLSAVGMIVMIRRLKWRALLHRDGLVLQRNGPPQVIPWPDVRYVREQNVNGHYSVRLQLTDQRLITLDANFRGIHELGAAVREGVTHAALVRAASLLERGEEVAFGQLKVSRSGLSNGTEQIAWEEVSELGVLPNIGHSGYNLVVRKPGAVLAWFSRPCREFPNLEAFLELASRFTKVTRPG